MFRIFSHNKKVTYEREKKDYTVIGKNKLDLKKRIISENVKKMNFLRGV